MEVHVQQQLKFFFPYNRRTEFTLSTIDYINGYWLPKIITEFMGRGIQ